MDNTEDIKKKIDELKDRLQQADNTNPEITENNGFELLSLAEKVDDKDNIMLAYSTLALCAWRNCDNDKVIQYSHKLRVIAEEANNVIYIGQANELMALHFASMGQEGLAVRYHFNAVKTYETAEYFYELCIVYQNIANLYLSIGSLEEAKEHFQTAEKYLEMAIENNRVPLSELQHFLLYLNYASLLVEMHDYDELDKYLEKIDAYKNDDYYSNYAMSVYSVYNKYAIYKKDNKKIVKYTNELINAISTNLCNYDFFNDFLQVFDVLMDINETELAEKICSHILRIAELSKSPSKMSAAYRRKKDYLKKINDIEGYKEMQKQYFRSLKEESTAMDYEAHVNVSSVLRYLKLSEKSNISKTQVKKLQFQSYYDSLTGAGSRYALEKYEEAAFSEAIESKEYFSCVIIDVDNFKQYNDSFGHLAGDYCLQKSADAISRCIGNQFLGRFGGDEFFLILIGYNALQTLTVCEKIQNEIKRISSDANSGLLREITFSIGFYSAIPENGETHFDFIDRADEALYRVKNNGRNNIIGNL